MRTVYQHVFLKRKQPSAEDTSTPVSTLSSQEPAVQPLSLQSSTNHRSIETPVLRSRPSLHRQISYIHPAADRRDTMMYQSIGPLARSVSNTQPNFLYRNESSYFNHYTRDSLRFSMGLTAMNRLRPDLNRSLNASFYRQGIDGNAMMGRLRSIQAISGITSENVNRQARRDEFYKRMKQREKEAQSGLSDTMPPLLTYLLKKATHANVTKEGTALVYTEDDVLTRRDESHKDEKENFLLDVMFTDSQIHIASVETGSSLLLYLYKGSMIVQKKPVQQRDYSILNTSLNKVDLFLGGRRAHSSPWISSKDIHTLNNLERTLGLQSFHSPSFQRPFKRIVQDFSMSLITRSQNGFLPSRVYSPGFRREDLVNRITVTIGAFSIRMTGEEFYRFLNVIHYTLLVNPTNRTVSEPKDPDSTSGSDSQEQNTILTPEMMKSIEQKVLVSIRGETELIPVLRVKYTLEEVEWTLLASKGEQIAVATLRGLTGEHNFCFDGKSESKIILNDLKILNPSTTVSEQRWEYPDLIFSPVMLDRAPDEQSNILEIIAVLSQSLVCDGIPVNVFEHVGINVYPGCHYYILFQLSSSVASGIFRYFFPEEDGELESLSPEPTEVNDTLSLPSSEPSSSDEAEKETIPLPNLQVGAKKPSQDLILELSDDNSVSTEVSPVSTPSYSHFQTSESAGRRRVQPVVAVPTSEDAVTTLRVRKNSNVSDGTSQPQGRFNYHKKRAQCNHDFELTDQSGVCAMCKKKIGNVRNLGYKCNRCGILVDQHCRDKLLGITNTKKQKKPRQLVFLEHMRLGTVELVISTRGITPLNLNNFDIVLQHQIYSNSLSTWSKVIKQIRRAYTTEVLKFAPSYVFRGWGFKNSRRQAEKRERAKNSPATSTESDGVLTDDMKTVLLLGNSYSVYNICEKT